MRVNTYMKDSMLFYAACILTFALMAPFFGVGAANAMVSSDESGPPESPILRNEFACPGMHAEWINATTVQCLKEH